LELNCKTTEVMVVSQKADAPKCNIFINGTLLKQCESFKCLGSLISIDGRNDKDISSRIGQAKMCFLKAKSILSNTQLSIDTQKRKLHCYIELILMYGCEAWTINIQIQKKLEAVKMWFLRRMLRIPWTVKKTNQEVLKEAVTERLLINRIWKRQAKFFGHVMRWEKMEYDITTRKCGGNWSRERPQEKMLDSLTSWLKLEKVTDILRAGQDRDVWREMIANSMKQCT